MATEVTVIMMRQILAFTGRSYQPLRDISGLTLDPPLRPSCSKKHENRPDLWVGRLHYSLCPTPSAHFRWRLLRVRA